MLYPTDFHKTKYLEYSNTSTIHKHTVYILHAIFANIRRNVIFATEMLEVFTLTFASNVYDQSINQLFNVAWQKIQIAAIPNVCKYCMQDLNKLYVYEKYSIHISDVLCFMKIGWI